MVLNGFSREDGKEDIEYCENCGAELDTDCNGDIRCEECDEPCMCCSDGAGYPYSFGIDEDYPD